MKLSMEWLKSFVDVSVSDKEYADALTMSGSKVETLEYLSDEIQNVVVGKLVSVEQHPNADKLLVCAVDIGKGEPVQIITGAPNVKAGDIVPVALHKSTLPGGKKITSGKLRGLESNGMLCSFKELALVQGDVPHADEDGILIMCEDDGELTLGMDIKQSMRLCDTVVDFEITNNRPDCLSVIGIARETSATLGCRMKTHTPEVRGGGSPVESMLSVETADPDLCPRYTARMVQNVKIEPSPLWMRRRLRSSGIRPINNIVDITNYVCLEYGQPMHAFDFKCVDGGKIVARRAKDGEVIETLDGQNRKLTGDMLVIADAYKPIAIAGVMGGEGSGISEGTQTIVLESANFNGPSVRKTALAFGMRTDASSRFEKGLDPLATIPAIERACELIEQLGAGTVCDGLIDVNHVNTTSCTIGFDPDKINAFLGTDIPREEMTRMLSSLGCIVSGAGVTAPSWRSDMTIWEDLAEEVARLYGYDKIKATTTVSKTKGFKTERQRAEDKAQALCRACGFDEMMTYSFIGPSDYDKICLPADHPLRKSMTLLNPLGEDTSVMRTTAIPSLLEALSRNQSAHSHAVKLFEIAVTYHPAEGMRSATGELCPLTADESPTKRRGKPAENNLPLEKTVLIMGGYGNGFDFLALKGCVEAILDSFRVKDIRFKAQKEHPSFHPGRCADVFSGDTHIGIIGEAHPAVAEHYGCKACCCELDFTALLSCAMPERQYSPLPRFPDLSRDLALVCDDSLHADDILREIRALGSPLLASCSLFDVYTGAQMPEGKKSLAYSLAFRANDRTLTDQEADEIIAKILSGLEKKFSVVLR